MVKTDLSTDGTLVGVLVVDSGGAIQGSLANPADGGSRWSLT